MTRPTPTRIAWLSATTVVATAALVASLLPSNVAVAQQQQPGQPAARPAAGGTPRIAVVDTSRVFGEMQETRDMRGAMDAERQRLQTEERQKAEEIKGLQEKRKLLKPDHPQFEELNRQIMQKAIDFEVWGKYAKMDAERAQKRQMRTLFMHIEQAVTEYAQKEGIDLVLSQAQPELPENLEGITFDQLRMLINSRSILFAGPKVDISTQVLALVDARYKASGAKPAIGAATPKPAGGVKVNLPPGE